MVTYAQAGTADLELAYDTLREYLRTIRLYSNESQPGFSRQEFASILTAYYVAESALINNAQTYYTESQKQIALDEAEKALKAAGVSQEILGVTEDLLESVDEADCILTVIEKNSLKQTYSVISDLTEIFLYGEDDDTVGTEGTGTFHALFAALLEIGSDKTLASANALASRFKDLQTQLISVGNIFGDGSTVVTNNYRSNLYSALGSYLSQEEKSRHDLSRAYTGTVDEAMGNEIAQRLGYADYAEMKALAESEKLVINGGRLNTALIEAKAITATMIAVEELFAQAITASKMTLTAGCVIGGKVSIANEKILMNTDGSGHLADGAITWDKDGNGEVSGAWMNPVSASLSTALNRTVYVGSSITVGRSISVGQFDSSKVSEANPTRRIGSVTIISSNYESPSYIYMGGASIIISKLQANNGSVSSLSSAYLYFILAPGASVTFDVFDDYDLYTRCLQARSPLGWFNFNGSVYPCSFNRASHEDLKSITVHSNAIGTSMSAGRSYKVISLPSGAVQFMKLKVSDSLSSSDDYIYFQKVITNQSAATSYNISKLRSETSILPSMQYCNYRDGGDFGFGYYLGTTSLSGISKSPTLYIKLYDHETMIAYFEITL